MIKLGLVGEEDKELFELIALELGRKLCLVGGEDKELRKPGLVGEEHKELAGFISGELSMLFVEHNELVVVEESGTDNVILGMFL